MRAKAKDAIAEATSIDVASGRDGPPMMPGPTRSARVMRKIMRRLPEVLAELTENEVRIIWSLVHLGHHRLQKKEQNGRNTSTTPRS